MNKLEKFKPLNDSNFIKRIVEKEYNCINLIVIFQKPDDYPDKCVGRLFIVKNGSVYSSQDVFIVKDSLQEIRNLIPTFYLRFDRSFKDCLSIVESWMW